MCHRILFFISMVSFCLNGFSQKGKMALVWPEGQKLAISLSYDDGLDSQLDNALPALEKLNFKASFYVLPNAASLDNRLGEWKEIAKKGHELGNHSMFHPCRKSLPDREWVQPHHDLDTYSLEEIFEELTTANTFLKALDGRTERTFTPPCGDVLAGKEDEYMTKLQELFVASKGQGVQTGFSVVWAPTDVSGNELIAYVKNVPSQTRLVNIIFHGIGGDHLPVSSEAHKELLNFLSDNSKDYYVDSYINIMKYVKTQN